MKEARRKEVSNIELNKIYNEDCIKGMANISNESVDLIVTDPPYLVKYKTGHRKDKNHRFTREILNDDNEQLLKDYIKECHRILKNDSAMYMFCSSNRVDFFKQELEKYFNIKNMIIWVKNNHTAGDLKGAFGRKYEIIFLVSKGRALFNGERLTDVWEFKRVVGKNQLHQNQKPIELIEQCITKHSNKNDVVFDGFIGSGTTAVACLNTKRNYIGFELDEEYYDTANERLAQHN
ncbi:site-specific DNA-methyltransferase [Staphylococcus pseudintermedius]|uniref:DNA-methyltransferase n=1 Tax=Staphylococcus pseudintermedius TaxID=283734 RepID=UPI0018F7A36F|nr:site-specific DNA-methyltransferase [Staphylococcus pseudintermedius]EJO7197238.1 site-specific DNA-methyltransferase [Staphylococcus pseudintermedius]ELJ9326565.1 site-specific DNA-methyltransferase [Staphylococcus pseudintermedius]MBJ8282730.1 site-specific DNA-methyltransferase [Staphylococcus pseudintermedius]HDV6252513.1 site-specific DNA-methyltransferase [Staphylococcus pseudintermedius]